MRAAVEMRVHLIDLPDIDRDRLQAEVSWLVTVALCERLGPVSVFVTRVELEPSK